MATATASEALDLLRRTRSDLIARGREVAQAIATEQGVVMSRQVRAAMVAEGSYRDTGCDRWLGAIFNRRDFEPVGFVPATYEDSPRASHEGVHIRSWKIRAS